MKREGTFCDFETVSEPHPLMHSIQHPCPNIAVGACISCGKDVCAHHGHANGVQISVRYEADGGGTVQILEGAITACGSCLESVKRKADPLRKYLLPGLLAQLQEGVRATLAVEATKK